LRGGRERLAGQAELGGCAGFAGSRGRWLAIALRKTAIPFLVTSLLFVLGAWFLQARLPQARSMGDVVRHLEAGSGSLDQP
jgi:hypothetical protein